jgi:hypothetical protein
MNVGNYMMTTAIRQAVPQAQPPVTTAVTNPAVLVAQNSAVLTRTQTVAALQGAGNTEQSRTGQDRKETGETVDSQTNAVTTRSRGGAPTPGRGQRLDVRV